MEEDYSSEAKTISKEVINNIVNNIIEEEDDNDQNSDKSQETEEGVSESLANALESLTEECAKEIFEDDKAELSSNTNKILSTFLGKDEESRAFTLTFDDSEDAHEVIDEVPKNNENLKHLDEITFSEDSESQPPLEINWETIDSRPASVNEAPPPAKSLEDKSDDRVMQEVIDEFAAEEESDASQLSENLILQQPRKSAGRRVKSTPKKRRISSSPEKNNEEKRGRQENDEDEEEEVEACQVAEDVDQIVDFLRQTAPEKEEGEKSSTAETETPDAVTNAIDESATHLKDGKQESFGSNKKEEGASIQLPPVVEKTRKVKRKRKMGRKRGGGGGPKKKAAKKVPLESPQQVAADNNAIEVEKSATTSSTTTVGTQAQKVFKPISNWHKLMKISAERPLAKSLVDQIFKNVLEPYVPCVPKNTSQRLIEALTERELEQLMCPGCKDRFLLPNTFIQHLYRRSANISFVCAPCGDVSLAFYNRCHLRTHILSHCEIDGIQSVAIKGPETIQVSSLESSDLHVGFVDDTYSEELKSLFSDYQVQESSAVKCSECEIPISNSFDHFNSISTDTLQECCTCKMWLPSKCSLSAHQRIHRKSPNFVCPECAEKFETWSVFKHHVQRTCHHEARVLVVECLLCTRKNNNISVYVDWAGVYGHLYQSHIQLFYKCSSCPKAYAEKMAIYQHREEVHKKESSSSGLVADFSVLYKAAFLKAPSKLFNTRQAFEARISPVIKRWKRLFKFKCFACQSYFENPQQLSSHNVRWCQMLHSASAEQDFSSSLFNANPITSQAEVRQQQQQEEQENDLTEKEALEKMNEHLAHLEALSNNCAECSKCSLDYRAHLVHHRKLNSSSSSASLPALSAKEKSSSKSIAASTAAMKANKSKNDDSDQPVGSRITRQRLEAHSSSTPTRSLTPTPNSAKKSIETTKTTTKMTAQKIEEKEEQQQRPLKAETVIQSGGGGGGKRRKKKPSVMPNSFVEALGIDVPSERHLLSFNRISKKALAFGATACKKKATPIEAVENVVRKCALCDFSTELADSFASHIRIHKPIINLKVVKEGPAVNFNENSGASDCLQCKECGMCFASEPSWRKHLFLLHRIKKPQASDYCDDLVTDKTNPVQLQQIPSMKDKYEFDDDEDDDDCSDNNSKNSYNKNIRNSNCNVCFS